MKWKSFYLMTAVHSQTGVIFNQRMALFFTVLDVVFLIHENHGLKRMTRFLNQCVSTFQTGVLNASDCNFHKQ